MQIYRLKLTIRNIIFRNFLPLSVFVLFSFSCTQLKKSTKTTIPFSAELDAAAVNETRISDINSSALAIGNGDINALIWYRNDTLCMRIAKNDIWDARINTFEDGPMLKVDVEKQKWSGGGNSASWGKPYPTPSCAAIIKFIPVDGTSSGSETSAKLDLRRALATIGDINIRAIADRNVFLIESLMDISIEEVKTDFLPAANLGETDGVKWLHMKMPGDIDYSGMEYALAIVSNGKHKVIAVQTSLDTKDNVLTAAIQLAKKTADANLLQLVAVHENEWKKYWASSGVQLNDPDFQTWWYRMVYMLRCYSKPGVIPAGLWAFQPNDLPNWHGDYHHNYNSWQPYWTSFVINHPDQAKPWIDYMNSMLPRLKWYAKSAYDCEGAFVGISSFAFEPDPEKCTSKNKRQMDMVPWGRTLGMIGMSSQILWYHHLYQPDRQYLKDKIYPVIREAALFFCSFAEKCPRDADGKVIFGPSYSPEHGDFGVHNVPYDLAYARFSLGAGIAAAEELGCDPELIVRFRKAIEILPDYPTALDADGNPIVVDWTGCKFREIQEHNIVVPDIPVFPGDQVTWFSPDSIKELFRNTIKQTVHRGCNSTILLSVAKARLSISDASEDLRNYYKPLAQPNGLFYLPMHGYYLSETVGVAAGISELLLQSVDNIIRVFPCWSKDKDATFNRLRAQGGFLVSAEQKAGEIVKIEITSTVGGTLRLLNPWTNQIVEQKTRPNQKIRFIKD